MDFICPGPGCYGFATSADWTFIFCGNDIDDIVVDCLNANSDWEQLISEVFLWLWASFRATVDGDSSSQRVSNKESETDG